MKFRIFQLIFCISFPLLLTQAELCSCCTFTRGLMSLSVINSEQEARACRDFHSTNSSGRWFCCFKLKINFIWFILSWAQELKGAGRQFPVPRTAMSIRPARPGALLRGINENICPGINKNICPGFSFGHEADVLVLLLLKSDYFSCASGGKKKKIILKWAWNGTSPEIRRTVSISSRIKTPK